MKITLIGAGNVATHLGKRLKEKGHLIVEVFSRTKERAGKLANLLSAKEITDLKGLSPNADLYIVAIKDDAIATIAAQLPLIIRLEKLIVHTSGATPSTVFQPYFKNYGIFYPLQTFSINKKADFEQLPICIDANSEGSLLILKKLGMSICPNIYQINDEQRAKLHVCAVFVNNFTNHLLAVAEDILTKENLTMDLLKPLIQETVNKIQEHPAGTMQTGPALRNDVQTLQSHLDFLSNYPKYQLIYQILSTSIQDFSQKNK